MKVFCVGEYKDPLKKMILAKGWSDVIASYELAQLIYNRTPVCTMQFDYIVPIPLHWSREISRGYNQAYEMGDELARLLNIECIDVLVRKRATPFQSSVDHTERDNNVKNVFVCKTKYKEVLKNKKILLIDDLMTTGATLKYAAKAIDFFSAVHNVVAVVSSRVR